MSKTQDMTSIPDTRMLTDAELDAVIGGTIPLIGYGPLGTHLNISPFSAMPLLDPTWELVGLTGQTPR